MKRLAILGACAVLALTGCDKLVGDHITPYPVQDSTRNPSHLTPGLWRAVPPQSVDGCLYSLFRDGYPVQRSEVFDQVPVYVFLPETTDYTTWALATRGCGEWVRVS